MTLSRLAAEDVEEVAELEQKAGDVHWSRAQFEKELHLPMSRFFVLRDQNGILGYGGYWKVDEEAQITNLVICPDHRRQGIGQTLLHALMDQASRENCRRSTLEVRAHNVAALRLYEKEGFLRVGLRVGFYTHPPDDAVLMEKRL